MSRAFPFQSPVPPPNRRQIIINSYRAPSPHRNAAGEGREGGGRQRGERAGRLVASVFARGLWRGDRREISDIGAHLLADTRLAHVVPVARAIRFTSVGFFLSLPPSLSLSLSLSLSRFLQPASHVAARLSAVAEALRLSKARAQISHTCTA